MATEFVFLCPHNAAKSVYAAAVFAERAQSRAIEVSTTTGGTHPDDHVLPLVRERLESLGLVVTSTPRVIPPEALDSADHIINIGCDHSELPTKKPIVDWSIPNFSDDRDLAFAALDDHVDRLLASLTI